MSIDTEAIIEKIRKTLALANDKNASDQERETAMRMAHKLLAKHNLSMAEIEASGGKTEKRGAGVRTFYGRPWAQVIASSIAKLMFCHYVVDPAKRAQDTRHYFIGRESNSISAAILAEFLVTSIRKEGRRRQRELQEGNAWGRSFSVGAASRIAQRVVEMLVQAKAEPSGDGKSRVLASIYRVEASANQDWVKDNMRTREFQSRGKEADADAHAEGAEYGGNLPLNRQLNQSDQKRIES